MKIVLPFVNGIFHHILCDKGSLILDIEKKNVDLEPNSIIKGTCSRLGPIFCLQNYLT